MTAPITVAGRTYRPDLSYPHLRIAIEYEGAHHLTHRWQWTSDISRERDFNDHGWIYIRVTADTDLGEFLTYLGQRLAERAGADIRSAAAPLSAVRAAGRLPDGTHPAIQHADTSPVHSIRPDHVHQ